MTWDIKANKKLLPGHISSKQHFVFSFPLILFVLSLPLTFHLLFHLSFSFPCRYMVGSCSFCSWFTSVDVLGNLERSCNREASTCMSSEKSLGAYAVKGNSEGDVSVGCFMCSFSSTTGQCVQGRPCFPESADACSVGPCASSPSSYCHLAFQLRQYHLILWVYNIARYDLVNPTREKHSQQLLTYFYFFTLLHVFEGPWMGGCVGCWADPAHSGCRKAGESKERAFAGQVAWFL